MIKEVKKWMCYYYFDRNPVFRMNGTFLYSPVKKNIPGMVRISFSTMLTDVKECDFVNTWSRSTRTKINKVQEDHLNIDRGRDLLPKILELFSATARSKNLRGHFPEDFDSRPWIMCSAVFQNENMLAGHVWVLDGEEKCALLFVNASAHHEESVDPSLTGRAHYYLLYQDGLYLRNNGIDCLDLNGYEPSPKDVSLSGVYKWKEGTHGQQVEYYNYYPLWFYWYRKWKRR